MADKRPTPRGSALRWTDADLDAMTSPEALMAPEAVEEARQWWARNANLADRNMLDPAPADPEPDA